jgi:hypothetical protein
MAHFCFGDRFRARVGDAVHSRACERQRQRFFSWRRTALFAVDKMPMWKRGAIRSAMLAITALFAAIAESLLRIRCGRFWCLIAA